LLSKNIINLSLHVRGRSKSNKKGNKKKNERIRNRMNLNKHKKLNWRDYREKPKRKRDFVKKKSQSRRNSTE
jgi:hypothetical protein